MRQTVRQLLVAQRVAHAVPATCDKCNHRRAYFYQLQIRSADEPMTTCMSSIVYCRPGSDRRQSTGITGSTVVLYNADRIF